MSSIHIESNSFILGSSVSNFQNRFGTFCTTQLSPSVFVFVCVIYRGCATDRRKKNIYLTIQKFNKILVKEK